MNKWHWLVLMVYLTAAAGYGGWRGPDLWSGWGVWCLVLPPLAWAALKAVGDWRRNRYWVVIKTGLVMTVVAVVAIGGQALVLAWAVAEATGRWSSDPAVRAVTGVGLGAAAAALVLAARHFGMPAEPRDTNGSVNTGVAAGPDAAPDPAGQERDPGA
jgi:hypothetical protein